MITRLPVMMMMMMIVVVVMVVALAMAAVVVVVVAAMVVAMVVTAVFPLAVAVVVFLFSLVLVVLLLNRGAMRRGKRRALAVGRRVLVRMVPFVSAHCSQAEGNNGSLTHFCILLIKAHLAHSRITETLQHARGLLSVCLSVYLSHRPWSQQRLERFNFSLDACLYCFEKRRHDLYTPTRPPTILIRATPLLHCPRVRRIVSILWQSFQGASS